ncbi:MAG: zinc ABC transporter substrate-binding protein [Anaerolineae bacterium]|nr:zinc ABC transporter substrate-binding protein [Anaerolineae bacterium]
MRPYSWFIFILCLVMAGCSPIQETVSLPSSGLKVLAAESFLADIVQNVVGNRAQVDSLVPAGLDPHAFEPTPQDIVRITNCDVIVLNGGGLEGWAQNVFENLQGNQLVLEASKGLTSRQPVKETADLQDDHEGDPHFWLDPNLVVYYVENIRDGFIQVDPAGENEYRQNAKTYIEQLKELDAWIQTQVNQIPLGRRLLVTNHESFGYFADRYGFRVVGAVIPSVSTGASPSAQQMAELITQIRVSGAPAIFLETGANPQLANQISAETGVKVVTNLSTHSIPPDTDFGSGYIAMMKSNVAAIVSALK